MMDFLYGIEIPQGLRELAGRHQRNIADLVVRLRTVGLDDASIEVAVDQLMATYRIQLIQAVKVAGAAHV